MGGTGQTRRTGRRKTQRLYYTDPRLMMTNVRMATALLVALACLPAVRGAECLHGGVFGIGKCCCTCQGKETCGGHWPLGNCKSDCDACRCFQSIDGLWRCANSLCFNNREIFAGKSCAVPPCRLCRKKMVFHSAACRGKGKCECDCGRRRLAVEGLWRCSKRPRHTRGIEACKSSNVGPCRKCGNTMLFHSAACRGKAGKCDNICDRRRLADAFPDCSICEGSGKTRSWFLRQPCENCFGIGKVRD